ncbi:hypothetical protein COCC4DRAFT_60486 [Bipolaris maydis ATCC 48331]|uniref:CCHC-type domain-containing protein n=3 Tax=Cochliobolus heterostrophus TaxID=5016 RepID=M2U572_COCH5|nr:uncharacterized protein COCC4DRAFT_60486 [Bipolaris maydis ATCC 48331]EMD88846.1 hypothetical protein COCHEDRAFT_1109404 [Bipolaris maydis C5]ENI05438.1 hypothetical protein COCC4DRAFT_60486 [Bipolaris maydis ATCC 48331]KAJ6205772.1 hypothetical protein PSV09DRAFT_1109404 [Bipolaris maydis]
MVLESRFQQLTDIEVWEHCIGMNQISDIPDFAREAANHIIVVCLDCEHWSNNTEETTEVGIATFSRQDVASLVDRGDFGDFGEHLLQQVQFYLLRLIETSHLPNQNPLSRGVLGNRFGKGRFVTFAQARQILHDLFVQPIKGVPGSKGNRPIVVLGHDVSHDKNNLKHKAIEFDMDPLGTVVRYIDTQVLAREGKCWNMPRKEQIGLKRLVENLWFEHSDPHTAANDAGRTLICAFQIGLGKHYCRDHPRYRMLEVATDIERYSVANFKSIGGVEEYCWRCGQSGHMKSACTATGLHCDECKSNKCQLEPGEEHISAHCMCVANTNAAQRRERDAQARAQKRKKKKYNSHGSSSSDDHGQPHSGDKDHPPSISPSQVSHSGKPNGQEATHKGHRKQPWNNSWRESPENGSSSRFDKRRGSGGGHSSRDGSDHSS